jgi:cytochrome c oxidase cbb3-type subunit 3
MTSEDQKKPDEQQGTHVYDGIVEEENRLPRWWLGILFGSVAFAVIYWAGDQQLKAWGSPRETFDKQMAAARAAQTAAMATVSAQSLVALSQQPAKVAEGKDTFASTCSPCHKADGSGLIGPNLTDEYWLHGGAPDKIWKTVHDGVPAKGMVAWADILGEAKVASVVAYVLTIKNTHVAGGKAPEGDRER